MLQLYTKMADREKIKMGMVELMAMSIEDIEKSIKDQLRFQEALKEYERIRTIAIRFIEVLEYDRRREEAREEYSKKHSGVML